MKNSHVFSVWWSSIQTNRCRKLPTIHSTLQRIFEDSFFSWHLTSVAFFYNSPELGSRVSNRSLQVSLCVTWFNVTQNFVWNPYLESIKVKCPQTKSKSTVENFVHIAWIELLNWTGFIKLWMAITYNKFKLSSDSNNIINQLTV